MKTATSLPVFDLHCDLTSYLVHTPGAQFESREMGATLPFLREGNVRLQVMAFFTMVEKGSTTDARRQAEAFRGLLAHQQVLLARTGEQLGQLTTSEEQTPAKVGIVAAIEPASGICEEGVPIAEGLRNLDTLTEIVGGTLAYIGLTHDHENRFGGGNSSEAGLKPDGKLLLEYISGRQIGIDLAHTSDALAYDLLNYIDAHSLQIPVLASHSNYRKLCAQTRNLPDELAKEVFRRKGVVGLNFLRKFLHPSEPEALYEHIAYALSLGGEDSVCMGADFFYVADDTTSARVPYYPKAYEDASKYPAILSRIGTQFGASVAEKIAYANAQRFLTDTWK